MFNKWIDEAIFYHSQVNTSFSLPPPGELACGSYPALISQSSPRERRSSQFQMMHSVWKLGALGISLVLWSHREDPGVGYIHRSSAAALRWAGSDRPMWRPTEKTAACHCVPRVLLRSRAGVLRAFAACELLFLHDHKSFICNAKAVTWIIMCKSVYDRNKSIETKFSVFQDYH